MRRKKINILSTVADIIRIGAEGRNAATRKKHQQIELKNSRPTSEKFVVQQGVDGIQNVVSRPLDRYD